ncbi:hypothetical protein [Agrobacterium larrymoorei]|uniref:Uncharacterized protein n=1 Tax=Agrobacterium larrymoorei TaxID=160699 RepID=A0ABU0ULW3_9HYPH|nr:hypothetical protein [Agrobacterium larrymoorei]MDQ1185957.1 hypothetical protein [Agrobacterium larrymoorei]
MTRRAIKGAYLDADQAEACLELWASRKFDTHDIHRILRVPEHAVCRLIQAARDLARMQR